MDSLRQLILYEDERIAVYNKPPGLAVQSSGDSPSLEKMIEASFENHHLISRIDQVVSGIVLTAKDKKTAALLSHRLRDRKIEKEYIAIVEGKLKGGPQEVEMKLVKNNSKAFVHASGKASRLTLEVIQELDRYTVLRILPLTGRFHQIRVMLAALGHPIKGDLKYGAKRSNPEPGIYLHSHSLHISDYPETGRVLSLKSPFPSAKLWGFVNSL